MRYVDEFRDDALIVRAHGERQVVKLLVLLWACLLATESLAGTVCTTRKSGSVTIETCTNTQAKQFMQCRSYMSGSVRKTYCRT